MDYAAPYEFPPSEFSRGVGEHPHRGFETVTIVYDGEVDHRDSAGGGGRIGPGDVQWMTAASGLVHEEKHGRDFSRRGGVFEMVQLWVNLPAKHKMDRPQYQGIRSEDIPLVTIPGGSVRVIAGDFRGTRGPASTFTPINLWDVRLRSGYDLEAKVPTGHTALVFVLSGRVRLASGETLEAAELGVLDRKDEMLGLTALEDAKLLFLGGQPIEEPIVGYGPFVMNSFDEIREAFADFQSGRMGAIPEEAH